MPVCPPARYPLEVKIMRRWLLIAVPVVLVALGSAWAWRTHSREMAWNAAYEDASDALNQFNYPRGEAVLLAILPKTEEWWPQSTHLLSTVTLLGRAYVLEGRDDLALQTLQRALNLSAHVPPGGKVDLGRIKVGLAIIARNQGRYAESEQLFSEALPLLEANPSAADKDDAVALGNLGYLKTAEGHYQEAESLLLKSTSRYQQALGSSAHPDLAYVYYQLGQTYFRDAHYAEAAEQFRLSANMYQRLVGANGMEFGYAIYGLGVAEQQLGHTEEANQLLARALKIGQLRVGSSMHPDGMMLNSLASLADRQGRYTEAEELYKKAIVAYGQAGKSQDAEFADTLEHLGCLYRDENQFDIRQAEPLLLHALSIREDKFGPDHAVTAATLGDLSLLYFYEKNFTSAKDFGLRALAIQEKETGLDSLEVSTTLNRIGIAERDLEEFAQAEVMLKRALRIREKLLAPNHLWIATSLENLASLYEDEGNQDKAEPLILRAQQIRARGPSQ